MGVYTIVTDYVPGAFAKQFADKSFDVDGMDISGLVQLAKHEKVDGVLVGVADTLIKSYFHVCDALGVPCYASQLLVDTFTQKDTFKQTCEKYGIQGIPQYNLDATMNPDAMKKVVYPVLVKPVDNCSGTGMSICQNEEELKAGIQKALHNSIGKRFLVERYMTCDDMFVYYTFKDGKYYLSAIADRFTTKEQGNASPVCLGAAYPSKYRDLYFEKMHDNMCRMFKATGVKNGVMLIQAFVENNEFYVYDPGFRLQGEAPHLLINSANCFDQREMLIRYALTGSMGDVNLEDMNDSLFHGKAAGSLWILLNAGTISSIEGMEDLKSDKEIIHIVQRMAEGDKVTPEMLGRERQVFARIYIVCNNKEAYKKKIHELQSQIKIYDAGGQNMDLKGFNPDMAWSK